MSAYTVTSLAERWGCSPDVTYDMIRKHWLKAFKVGRNLRISAEEVNRYENQD